MVEFKVCERTGTPYLMEVNGRFWGSLQLAIDAGVDFPALLLGAAFGELRQGSTQYHVGTRCRWWWGDVDHFLAVLKSAVTRTPIPGGRPSVLRALARLLRPPGPHDRLEVLRLRDPMPFLRESRDWIADLAHRE
jgi:hypothetical protein